MDIILRRTLSSHHRHRAPMQLLLFLLGSRSLPNSHNKVMVVGQLVKCHPTFILLTLQHMDTTPIHK